MNEDIFIQDINTERVFRGTMRMLKVLGPNYRRTAHPAGPPTREVPKTTAPKKEVADTKEPETESKPQEKEMTREEYIEAIKAMRLGLKGVHLYSLDKLKKTYEDNVEKDG